MPPYFNLHKNNGELCLSMLAAARPFTFSDYYSYVMCAHRIFDEVGGSRLKSPLRLNFEGIVGLNYRLNKCVGLYL